MKKYAYIHVSSKDQKVSRVLERIALTRKQMMIDYQTEKILIGRAIKNW